MALQFTRTRGRSLRTLRLWMARAISSFPVPVSPLISTVESVGATCSTLRRTARTVADDFFEVVLGANLFLEVDVFLLQPRFQPRDLFVGFHVLDRQRHLGRHFLQKLRVRFGILVLLPAHYAEGADALAPQNQRNDTERAKALFAKAPLVVELPFFFEIAAEKRLLMIERPASRGFGAADLQTGLKVAGPQRSF